jgi:hypothetical protein
MEGFSYKEVYWQGSANILSLFLWTVNGYNLGIQPLQLIKTTNYPHMRTCGVHSHGKWCLFYEVI